MSAVLGSRCSCGEYNATIKENHFRETMPRGNVVDGTCREHGEWPRPSDIKFRLLQGQDTTIASKENGQYCIYEVHDMQSDVQHRLRLLDYDVIYSSESNIFRHRSGVQSRLANKPNMVVKDSVTSELARYKELVGEYEKRANTYHYLIHTVGHYKSKTGRTEYHFGKKDLNKRRKNSLKSFLDIIKRLKEKVEDRIRLYKQDQSVQTVHMICKPKSFYDEKNKVAIGYKNPLCLTRAKQVQPTLYNGHVLVMSNHARPVVHDSVDTRDMAEITRKRMMEKMQSPLCVENKIRIATPDYSKENLLATFAPQRNLTLEHIFWSIDENDRKKAKTSVPKPLSALTVYPPNTPVKLVPKVLPTKSQVKINLYVLTQLFIEFEKTCKKRITPTGVTEGERESYVTYNAKDVTALIEQNDCVKVELEKVKQHYKELYDSIKITRAHTSEKTSTMLNEIESLKAQLRSKVSCFTSDSVKPKVLAPGMHAIDVIPTSLHPLKNNRSAQFLKTYISHLKGEC
ncbi:hypothetical protein Tco_0307337 [Tanacetum coccineum]